MIRIFFVRNLKKLKGALPGGYWPPIFICLLESPLLCEPNKKNRIKKYWFLTKLWPFKDINFWCSKKSLFPRKPDLWRHLGHLFQKSRILSTDRGEEMAVEREQIDFRKILIYLFRRKRDRRIQKNRFRDLVINATSGMKSSITT